MQTLNVAPRRSINAESLQAQCDPHEIQEKDVIVVRTACTSPINSLKVLRIDFPRSSSPHDLPSIDRCGKALGELAKGKREIVKRKRYEVNITKRRLGVLYRYVRLVISFFEPGLPSSKFSAKECRLCFHVLLITIAKIPRIPMSVILNTIWKHPCMWC